MAYQKIRRRRLSSVDSSHRSWRSSRSSMLRRWIYSLVWRWRDYKYSSLRGTKQSSHYENFTMKSWYIYIMANERNGTLYIWVTNSILRRIEEHRLGITPWFTKKYNCKTCVYYEYFDNIKYAIIREKQLKWWNRRQKIELIESINPEWNDLMEKIKECT